MPFSLAKQMIDYLYNLWTNHIADYDVIDTHIGFYGGEPLLNFRFISEVVSYLESHPLKNRHFTYNMTTNATLLDKYMDFLVEKKFHLLISLDGDEEANSYRVDKKGRNSFEKVIKNVKLLQEKYPEYFDRYVGFNSVLTNRGNIFRSKEYIRKEFKKDPTVSEVNNFGIVEGQKKRFEEIYKSVTQIVSETPDKELLEKIDFVKNPRNKIAHHIIKNLSGNCFRTYNALLPQKECSVFPTGTCSPFEKKLFVDIKGDILPCERINQKYSLGHISEKGVELNFEDVANKYSERYERVHKKCKGCFAKPICDHCMFYIDDLDGEPSCPNYLTKDKYDSLISLHLKYLAENPQVYKRIMTEMF